MRDSCVHFAIVEGDDVRPLCGDWADSVNWTREPAVVSCPACNERLAEQRPEASTLRSA